MPKYLMALLAELEYLRALGQHLVEETDRLHKEYRKFEMQEHLDEDLGTEQLEN